MSAKPIFQPNDAPAGGWGALHATAKALREESAILKGGRSLLSMNQPDGFDCPGCAWPDPKHTSSFEFCENGAKAVAWETTKKRVTREFFAAWTVSGVLPPFTRRMENLPSSALKNSVPLTFVK